QGTTLFRFLFRFSTAAQQKLHKEARQKRLSFPNQPHWTARVHSLPKHCKFRAITRGGQGSVERMRRGRTATVCFARLEPTLHGSPALSLPADVVVPPLYTRH